MSDETKEYQATPSQTLMERLMSEFEPKSELEWFAKREIERLRKYEELVGFIANDYHELSHDKIAWQRNDWKKRCYKLIGLLND